MAAQIELAEGGLVAAIANPPEGEVCFLCATSNETECIWTEIGDDIVDYGCASAIHLEDRVQMHTPPLTLADFHCACHFACYRRYTFTVSSWISGMGCIRIPSCIEGNIWHAFPGDGVFVGFQDRNKN